MPRWIVFHEPTGQAVTDTDGQLIVAYTEAELAELRSWRQGPVVQLPDAGAAITVAEFLRRHGVPAYSNGEAIPPRIPPGTDAPQT